MPPTSPSTEPACASAPPAPARSGLGSSSGSASRLRLCASSRGAVLSSCPWGWGQAPRLPALRLSGAPRLQLRALVLEARPSGCAPALAFSLPRFRALLQNLVSGHRVLKVPTLSCVFLSITILTHTCYWHTHSVEAFCAPPACGALLARTDPALLELTLRRGPRANEQQTDS